MMDGKQNWWTNASWVAGALALGLYLLTCGLYWAQINDDAFITFRYSKFLAMGRGPYFNVGEHVEGYTNFLMMLLMAAAIRLFGDEDVLFVAKLIGICGGIVAIAAGWALGRRWLCKITATAPAASCLAWCGAGLTAVTCTYAFNSTSGLETTLFSAFILLGLLLDQKQRDEGHYRAAGVAFALAALTRPEGTMVFAAALAGRLFSRPWRQGAARRHLLWDCLIVGGIVLGQLIFRYAYYDGELLPNTYYAKRGGYGASEPAAYVFGFVYYMLALVTPLLSLAVLAARAKSLRLDALPGFVTAWASVGVIWLTGPDWMTGYRLLMPYMPLWGALMVAGTAALAERATRRAAGLTAAVFVTLPAALFLWQAPARQECYDYAVQRSKGYIEGHAALADWLMQRARPGDTIALMDIGIVGYNCIDQHVLDITGLTDRHIAKSPGGFLNKDFDPAYVFERRPRYLVIAVEGREAFSRANAREMWPWTAIETRLVEREEFRRHYADPPRELTTPDDLEWVAGLYGARAVFRHLHPALAYYLFVYEYHESIVNG